MVPQPVTTPSPGILVFSMPKSVAAVLDVHVELLEGVLVHQQLDALARGELAALVLGVDARLAAAETRFRPPPLQLLQHFLHGGTTYWLAFVEIRQGCT